MGGKSRKRFSFLHIVLLLCIFGLGAGYTFTANSIVQDNFSKKSIEKDIAEFEEAERLLAVKLSEVGSLSNIKELSSSLGLEEVKNISYIHIKKNSPLVLND